MCDYCDSAKLSNIVTDDGIMPVNYCPVCGKKLNGVVNRPEYLFVPDSEYYYEIIDFETFYSIDSLKEHVIKELDLNNELDDDIDIDGTIYEITASHTCNFATRKEYHLTMDD